jgi:hypothetical protein
MAKGRPKKKKSEVLEVITVRVPKNVRKVFLKWGKNKGTRISRAILQEDKNDDEKKNDTRK